MPVIEETVRVASATLASAGVPDPEGDARELLLHVLALDDASELTGTVDLTDHHRASLAQLVARRAAREPLEHLTGRVSFRDIELEVGPGVFVPQPETAAVVAWTVAAVAELDLAAPVIVDLCTGAGTIAFALANELPQARIHAVERDPVALGWTRRNAERRIAAGDTPVTLHAGEVEGALPELDGHVDVVVSNPPYVATTEAHIPRPEVVGHDPAIALWAGPDGLAVIRQIEVAARRLLRPGGLVVVEHSDRQGETAPAVFTATGGWQDVADHVDHEGRDRFVTARRRTPA